MPVFTIVNLVYRQLITMSPNYLRIINIYYYQCIRGIQKVFPSNIEDIAVPMCRVVTEERFRLLCTLVMALTIESCYTIPQMSPYQSTLSLSASDPAPLSSYSSSKTIHFVFLNSVSLQRI